MTRLPTAKMLDLLKFATELTSAKRDVVDFLSAAPDKLHALVNSDGIAFFLTEGNSARLQNMLKRIMRGSPSVTRKWSSDRCVVRSFAMATTSRNEIGGGFLSVGRCHSANQILCALFSRIPDNGHFSLDEFELGHLAVGYALELIDSSVQARSAASEIKDRQAKRVIDSNPLGLATRIDQFLSNED